MKTWQIIALALVIAAGAFFAGRSAGQPSPFHPEIPPGDTPTVAVAYDRAAGAVEHNVFVSHNAGDWIPIAAIPADGTAGRDTVSVPWINGMAVFYVEPRFDVTVGDTIHNVGGPPSEATEALVLPTLGPPGNPTVEIILP